MAHLAGLYRRRQYFYFKYKDDNGKWIERATRTNDRKKALSIKSEFLRELEAGQLPNDRSRWTLGTASEAWLVDRKLRVARSSYHSETTIVRALKRHFGTDAKLAKLANIRSINQYQTARLNEGLSPKTVNNEVLVLGSILRDASLWHRVSGQYKPLRFRKSDIGQALDGEERVRLLQVAGLASPTAVAPYAAVLAFATGMRSREIQQLQIGSIHLDENKPFLYVRRCTTKTNAGARYVALDTMACWALSRLMARATLLGATDAKHYLLPTLLDRHTKQGDPLRGKSGYDPFHAQSSWDAEWNRLRKASRIEHRRFHDLRHTYISRAAEAGVPLLVIQAQVGHISAQMTQHYTHISTTANHDAATLIEQKSPSLLLHLADSDTSTSQGGTR
ncbi:MAG TPA: site-specific integrase [Terriglobales bacterium]|jgi:integrase|nr:site-specific integrase [Terriglobales bacterium]